MGRQIEFVHTEEDIAPFLSEIAKEGGMIIQNKVVCSTSNLTENVLLQMSTPFCRLFIASNCSDIDGVVRADALSGTVIEFLNCRKGNSLSRTYEVGRLFLAADQNANSAPDLLLLYKALNAYIKKHYLYSPQAKLYYSPAFKAQYDRKYYYAARMGKLITL